MEPLMGQIILFAGTYAPKGWAMCDGQLLSIAQNSALFSLLGTTYGGDGRTTFALPDLRGRVPMHPGQGPGLSPRDLGQQGGLEDVTLTQNQIPGHTHALNTNDVAATDRSPTGNMLAQATTYAGTSRTPAAMSGAAIGMTGGSQPHDNVQPFTCINFIIATEGVYPARP
jgi:microcystin-dependent protein